MRKLLIVTSLAIFGLASVPLAQAQEGKSRMAICGQEWKEHKATNGKPAKGEGVKAWQAFRAECFTRHPKPAKG